MDKYEYAYLLGFVLPCTAVAAYVLEAAWHAGEKVQKKAQALRRRKELLASLPDVVRRAHEKQDKGHLYSYFDRQIKRSGWKISPVALITLSAVLAAAGAATGLFLLKNMAIAVTTVVILVFVPLLMLNWAVQKYESRVLQQLPTAIQMFSVEFEMTKSIPEALSKVSESVGEPLKKHLAQCAKDLTAGRNPRIALEKLSGNLSCEYGSLWAKLLLAATEDSTVMKMMPRLTGRLNEQRLLMQKNLTELSSSRRLGILLNILVVPGFVITQVIFPDTLNFYAEPLGRVVIMMLLLSIAVGIALDQA
ncbi:MAG: hypothetical protein K6U74_15230, partial [Firmicutes bacterium]|nr:hypothetical protein [Bacillota bacterium]